ncbi:7978_t:CDS:2 [Ambispora leptoticha]|uniref:7978_t:CDS:1 n=1 Tax=Ambispora leptoticha TaxID=144679 RepID=A0A9N9GER2_9GLOM|nr:7978_t:CDS:2 [Ambispora leptoticha]
MSNIILCCLVFGDPIEHAFTVKIDRDETISELKEIIKTKKQNAFYNVDANELVLWKVNVSLDKQDDTLLKNASVTDLKTVLNGEKLLPLFKIRKAFPNEPDDEHIHVIVQHHHKQPETLITVVEKINELEKRLDLMRSSFVVGKFEAEEISTKFIKFSDANQVERWQISYESSAALCFRDRYGQGDKRYAMWNNQYKDL